VPADTRFWDRQIAQGSLSMSNLHYPTYVNVMLYGESGLGKTVSSAVPCGDKRMLYMCCHLLFPKTCEVCSLRPASHFDWRLAS
jgi:hypothetical protein